MWPKQHQGSFSTHVKWCALHFEPESTTQSHKSSPVFCLTMHKVLKLLSPRKLGSQEKAVLTGRRETPAEPRLELVSSPLSYRILSRDQLVSGILSGSNMKEGPLPTLMTVRWLCSLLRPEFVLLVEVHPPFFPGWCCSMSPSSKWLTDIPAWSDWRVLFQFVLCEALWYQKPWKCGMNKEIHYITVNLWHISM